MKSGDQSRAHILRLMGLGLGLGLVLLFAVACGASATATPRPTNTAVPVAATAVPAAATAVPVVPTSAPVATQVPAATGPTGSLILATSDWGNELFSDHDVRGEGGLYQGLAHDFILQGEGGKKVVPGLATEWSFTPDGLTWTFVMREGVKYHNGDIMTAEDAAYAMEENLGPRAETESVSPTNANMSRVTEPWVVSGPNSISVTTDTPQTFLAFYLSEMFAGPRGTIFQKAYRESVGRDGYNDDPTPGTTGPWMLEQHDKGSRMLWSRFADYWKLYERNHSYQNLDMRLIPELSTRVAALRAGEADLVEANLEVRDQVEDAGGQIIFGPEALYLWFLSEGCWPDNGTGHALDVPCDKQEFRQALDYALDKELIAEEIYGGEMAIIEGWAHVTPASLGYKPDLDSWPYDVEKARELMASIGCAEGSCFPDPYQLYTWEAGELPFVPEVSQLVCAQWEEAFSINCEVEVGDSVSIKDKMHSFEIAGFFTARPNEARFDGGSIMFSGYASPQPTRGMNADLKAVVQKATELVGTMEERHEAYYQANKVAREQHWEWSLFYTNSPWAAGPKVKSWSPSAMVPYASALWTVELNQ